ncbi:unnamed protein product, partial [Mesorhabditis belari]|uniref:G-protein coupled receptors family 1 profile domain-containing protein n=1 Tax=Mesorhabditis belari TaxID=2138241 RepID=A0AAF3F4F2_9BILA
MCEPSGPQLAPSSTSNLLVFCGSFVSLISVCTNSILLYSLRTNQKCFRSYFYFLYILAFLDILISLLYIPVIAFDHWKDAFESRLLSVIWWSCFRYLLTLTNVGMTMASYILLGALAERYFITIRSRVVKRLQENRHLYCALAGVFALFTKGPIFLEFTLIEYSEKSCTGTYKEYFVDVTPLVRTLWYGSIYRFWLRNFLTIFIPFSLLLFINIRTVQILKSQIYQAKHMIKRKFSVSLAGRKKVRAATKTLLLVCLTYLLSNLPNVIITAWEFIDINDLQKNHVDLYMFTTDLVSLLVMLACALRLPIYLLSNEELRLVVKKCFGGSRATGELLKTASQLYTAALHQN